MNPHRKVCHPEITMGIFPASPAGKQKKKGVPAFPPSAFCSFLEMKNLLFAKQSTESAVLSLFPCANPVFSGIGKLRRLLLIFKKSSCRIKHVEGSTNLTVRSCNPQILPVIFGHKANIVQYNPAEFAKFGN